MPGKVYAEDTMPVGELSRRGAPVGQRPPEPVQKNQLRAIAPIVMSM
ncbi:hypothetical protein FHS41_006599 [Streptomyces violarus]|uniref:Uncharacterized protein n=1 Tax=Streptomyces violarus TaxID=67380 RepID=A0A7W5F4Q7_9ACTN|nr:hypothetical protein [Streptomyces violarus]